MRDGRPSQTAAWVAALRAATPLLPPAARLVDDPWALRFAGAAGLVVRAARLGSPGLRALPFWPPLVLHFQLRTRAIDDELLRFAGQGGRQVLLLGAGFDARAARFPHALARARVFEIDHPATQARKRRLYGDAAPKTIEFLPWDFEREPLSSLPSRLAALGHDPAQPTFTIWEGVTMYLTDGAIAATLDAVAALSAPGSPLALTYLDRRYLDRTPLFYRAGHAVLAQFGEPFRNGFDPEQFPSRVKQHGFRVQRDETSAQLAKRYRFPTVLGWNVAKVPERVAVIVRE